MIIPNISPLSRHYYLTIIISPVHYLTSISRPGAASIHQYFISINSISPVSHQYLTAWCRQYSPVSPSPVLFHHYLTTISQYLTIHHCLHHYKLYHRCLASISPDISQVSRRGLAYFTIISPAFSISPPFHQYLAVVSPISISPLYYLASISPLSHQISYHGKSSLFYNGLTQLTILQLFRSN